MSRLCTVLLLVAVLVGVTVAVLAAPGAEPPKMIRTYRTTDGDHVALHFILTGKRAWVEIKAISPDGDVLDMWRRKKGGDEDVEQVCVYGYFGEPLPQSIRWKARRLGPTSDWAVLDWVNNNTL